MTQGHRCHGGAVAGWDDFDLDVPQAKAALSAVAHTRLVQRHQLVLPVGLLFKIPLKPGQCPGPFLAGEYSQYGYVSAGLRRTRIWSIHGLFDQAVFVGKPFGSLEGVGGLCS